MSMISFTSRGDFKKTRFFFNRMTSKDIFAALERYGEMGVSALAAATPLDSGITADSWRYSVRREHGFWAISWHNDNFNKGVPIAIILQYGHGTGTGGYVQGRDYINPSIRPIFDEISESVWRVVTSA